MENKKNHQVNIVRLGEPRVHPNADTLELYDIGSYQVVVKKGQYKAGDFAVYIQPDSIIPQMPPFSFIWETYVGLDGTVPEKRRRITVRKFRGEWSEGLLMQTHDFPVLELKLLWEGTDVSELLGITHYDPDKGKEPAADAETFKKKRRKYPRSFKGWWYLILHKLGIYTSGGQNHGFDNEDGLGFPIYDVDALKHYKHAFNPEELVTVEEKIHGSNARFVYKDEHMYCSSRTQWKSDKANCIWRNVLKTEPWINDWCLAHEGYCLYAEICPTQGEKFQYGNAGPHIFVFDVRSPEGKWLTREEIGPLDLKEHWVPVLWQGLFKDIPWTIVDGQTTVPNAKGIREGVVIRPVNERHVHGLGRLILKEVSKAYLEKETK
jgi:hypothetical protein